MTATAHWDDAPTRRVDVGPMGADWDFLGRSAGMCLHPRSGKVLIAGSGSSSGPSRSGTDE